MRRECKRKKRMSFCLKPLLTVMFLCCMCLGLLTGCQGREGMDAFEIPESFDMTRNYEISFWAKNDTNRTQTAIYEKAIADFEKLYPNIDRNYQDSRNGKRIPLRRRY